MDAGKPLRLIVGRLSSEALDRVAPWAASKAIHDREVAARYGAMHSQQHRPVIDPLFQLRIGKCTPRILNRVIIFRWLRKWHRRKPLLQHIDTDQSYVVVAHSIRFPPAHNQVLKGSTGFVRSQI
jgi:hypothetical protein